MKVYIYVLTTLVTMLRVIIVLLAVLAVCSTFTLGLDTEFP